MHPCKWFMRRRFSKLLARHLLNYVSLGRVIYNPRDFICANLNLLVPRILHTKYKFIQASGYENKF